MPEDSKPSTICYLEIPAPSIEKAGAFYKSVFKWKITPSDLTDKEYWEFSTGEGHLTGGLDSSKNVIAGGVILYLKVENIETTLAKIVQYGGSVESTKFEIGSGYGYSAIFNDPNGNSLGLFSTD